MDEHSRVIHSIVSVQGHTCDYWINMRRESKAVNN